MRQLGTPVVGETRRRGSALVLALMAVLGVSSLAVVLLQISGSITRRQSTSQDLKQAFYLAESGLAEGYTGLALARTGNVGTPEEPAIFGGGMFWVEAERVGELVELKSTGLYGGGRVTLGLVVEPVEILISKLGFHTADAISVNPDTIIDSFDSEVGTYASQVGTPTNNLAVLGSNNDVNLSSGDIVFGDVRHGPAGSASVGTAVITGSVTAAPSQQELPPVDVPAIPLDPKIDHSGVAPLVLAPGERGHTSITVRTGSRLIVKGPQTLVAEDLSVARGAEIHFDTTDGPVDVYVTGDLALANDSLVTLTDEVTSDVIIQVASSDSKSVFFGADATFYGFIYAPEASVKMSAKFEVFGGLVAKSLNLSAQGRMHYDLSLDPSRKGVLPRLYAWRVVDIPRTAASGRDPFEALGVDPAMLEKPADAHEDQYLEIKYYDSGGQPQSYSGWESQFDWSDVDVILYAKRDGQLFTPPAETLKREEDTAVGYLLDLVDSELKSSDLEKKLLAASPVGDTVLIAAANRVPEMDSGHLKDVLRENGPKGGEPKLSDEVLLAAIGAPLDSGHLRDVLEDNSPLSAEVLTQMFDRSPALKSGDLDGVLAKQ